MSGTREPVAAGPAHAGASPAREAAPARRSGPGGGILSLQANAGNRAVARLLATGGEPVVRRCGCGGGGGVPCAKCAAEDEEEKVRRMPSAEAGSRGGAREGGGLSPGLRAYLSRSRGGGRPLDAGARRSLEGSFGRDLGGVRVHTGPAAASASREIRARAFALGRDIWFGAGEYRPDDARGRYLLAHEVAHTLEQRAPASLDRVRLGAESDPAEARADRAAAAVFHARPAPAPGRSEGVVHRYAITRAERVERDGRTVVEVDTDAGIRYTVERRCDVIRDDTTEPRYRSPDVSGGADARDVWVTISWCQGTRGEVTVGADLPQQAIDAVRRLVQAARTGGSLDAVARGIDPTPFIDFAVAQSSGVSVRGRVEVTVDNAGVRAGEGSLTVSSGAWDVGVSVSGSSGGGVQGTLRIIFTPGRDSESFDCPTTSRRRERLTERCYYQCSQRPINPPPRPEPPPPDRATVTLYYNYAFATFNEALSGPERERLRTLLGEGYRVEGIRGYASPEGPMEPRSPRGFQGNRTLSAQRAERAREELTSLCTGPGAADGCLSSADSPVTGCGERFGGAPECEPLAEGQERTERLGDDVAREAVREFMADETEMARLTPTDREALARARTDRQRARIIYPYLRRATLSLVRVHEAPPPPPIDVRELLRTSFVLCPFDVEERARALLEPLPLPGPRR